MENKEIKKVNEIKENNTESICVDNSNVAIFIKRSEMGREQILALKKYRVKLTQNYNRKTETSRPLMKLFIHDLLSFTLRNNDQGGFSENEFNLLKMQLNLDKAVQEFELKLPVRAVKGVDVNNNSWYRLEVFFSKKIIKTVFLNRFDIENMKLLEKKYNEKINWIDAPSGYNQFEELEDILFDDVE